MFSLLCIDFFVEILVIILAQDYDISCQFYLMDAKYLAQCSDILRFCFPISVTQVTQHLELFNKVYYLDRLK